MEDITAQELKQRLDANEDVVVIDVREEWEYEEVNIGAQNIPLGHLPEKLEAISHLKEIEFIVHCRTGGRSTTARKYLEKQGFTKVRSLAEGIEGFLKLD